MPEGGIHSLLSRREAHERLSKRSKGAAQAGATAGRGVAPARGQVPTMWQQVTGTGDYMKGLGKQRKEIGEKYQQMIRSQSKDFREQERKFNEQLRHLMKDNKLSAGLHRLSKPQQAILKDVELKHDRLLREYGVDEPEKLPASEVDKLRKKVQQRFSSERGRAMTKLRSTFSAQTRELQKRREKEKREAAQEYRKKYQEEAARSHLNSPAARQQRSGTGEPPSLTR